MASNLRTVETEVANWWNGRTLRHIQGYYAASVQPMPHAIHRSRKRSDHAFYCFLFVRHSLCTPHQCPFFCKSNLAGRLGRRWPLCAAGLWNSPGALHATSERHYSATNPAEWWGGHRWEVPLQSIGTITVSQLLMVTNPTETYSVGSNPHTRMSTRSINTWLSYYIILFIYDTIYRYSRRRPQSVQHVHTHIHC